MEIGQRGGAPWCEEGCKRSNHRPMVPSDFK
jgi:hypothetical protein